VKDAELRAVRAELAKKEDALEKLRQRVVGRSGDS
jgi:rRNA processing protein Krr1/Pno1